MYLPYSNRKYFKQSVLLHSNDYLKKFFQTFDEHYHSHNFKKPIKTE